MSAITFAGDSNTTANYVPVEQTFAHLIGTALGFNPVINAGISGEDAAGLLNRMPSLCAAGPARMVAMTGTNDAAHSADDGGSVDALVAAYIATMGQVITACTVPLTIFSAPMSLSTAADTRLAEMARALEDLCWTRGVHFFDVYDLMARDAATMSNAAFVSAWLYGAPDEYHLIGGHAKIAAAFLKTQWGMGQGGAAPIESGLILQNYGTPIGDMVSGGGLVAAFDGNKAQAAAACAKKANTSVTAYIGKSYPAAKTIRGFKYWGSSDQGVSQGAYTVELQCWVQSGAAPTSDINGSYIGGSPIMADANGLVFETMDLSQTTADHVWIRVISTGELASKFCAEVEFFEDAP